MTIGFNFFRGLPVSDSGLARFKVTACALATGTAEGLYFELHKKNSHFAVCEHEKKYCPFVGPGFRTLRTVHGAPC